LKNIPTPVKEQDPEEEEVKGGRSSPDNKPTERNHEAGNILLEDGRV
jgi:hypothetical protein